MIPQMHIVAWGNVVPWADPRQIEQDLMISRAVVEIFSDEFLSTQLRFRGGTALNKLHFPAPLRYSEDIDLVRTEPGPIRLVFDRLRAILEPWLGVATFDQSVIAARLRFRVPAEGGEAGAPLRLKIEINLSETNVHDTAAFIPFNVSNPWFSGKADVNTFSREEMLATKLRALLQRDKGRDLLDLAHALGVFDGLDDARIVKCFQAYLGRSELRISRAEAEMRMLAKLNRPKFLADIRPLLAADYAEELDERAIKDAFGKVMMRLIGLIPGKPWAKTQEQLQYYGISEALD